MAGRKKSSTPKRTRKAVGDVGRKVKPGVEIRTFTIGIATVLEEIESPLVQGKKPKTNIEVLESIFAMTHPAGDSLKLLAQGRAAFKMAAVEWGDELSIEEAAEIIVACVQGVQAACGVVGGGGTEGNAPLAVMDG